MEGGRKGSNVTYHLFNLFFDVIKASDVIESDVDHGGEDDHAGEVLLFACELSLYWSLLNHEVRFKLIER